MERERGRRGLVVAIALASALVHAVGLGLMASAAAGGGYYRLLYFFKRGGWGMDVIFALAVLGLASLVFFGLWLTRPERGRTWLVLILPAIVGLSGVFFERRYVGKAYAAVAGEPVGPESSARIFGMGAGEAASNTTLALIVAAVLLSGAAVVFGARAAQRVPPRLGPPAGGALAAGVVGLVALAVAASLSPAFQTTALLWLPAAVGVFAIALAATALGGEERDDGAAGDLFAAAACSLGGVALGCQAVWGAGLGQALYATGREAFPPTERAKHVGQGLAQAAAGWRADLAFALPVLLALTAAIIAARPQLRRGLLASRGLVLGVALTSAGLVLAVLLPRRGDLKRLSGFTSHILPADVTPPIVASGKTEDGPPRPILMVGSHRIRARDRDLDHPALENLGPVETLDGKHCTQILEKGRLHYRSVALDSSTTYRRMYCVALALQERYDGRGKSQRPPQFGIVAGLIERGEQQIEWLANKDKVDLPPPFKVLATVRVAILLDTTSATTDRQDNHVHLERNQWLLRQGAKVTPVKGTVKKRLESLRKRLEPSAALGISAEADVPAVDVLQVAAVTSERPARLALFGTTKELLSPTRPAEAVATNDSLDPFEGPNVISDPGTFARVRIARALVQGSLPRGIVDRLVRLRGPTYLQCWKAALDRSRQRGGDFEVEFKIEPGGNVSGVKSSDVHIDDPKLVKCVLGSFHTLRFPGFDGEPVAVSVPLAFQPGISD